jgi:GT2 family glycosyltransferase
VNTGRTQLTVVIPTYRRPALLRRCLESLSAQDARGSFDVVVVDDASGDDTTRLLKSHSVSLPELTFTSLPANRGQAAARNKGVELASAPTVLFVDDDIVASPSLISTHLRLLGEGDDKLGIVGLVEWHPDLPATPFRRWLDSTQLQFGYHTWMSPGPIEPPEAAFYTCNLSMPVQLFRDAGGFNEELRSLEDIELGHRLGRLGFRLDYRPEALAWHARDIDLDAFCRRQVVVGEAAVRLRDIDSSLNVDIDGMLAAQRGPLAHALLSLSSWLPRVGGRDLRSAYYWSRVAKAYARGVRSGSASSS